MASNKKQSALEAEAIKERKIELANNISYGRGEGKEYSESHVKAKSNPNNPLGKGVGGTNMQAYTPILDKANTSKTQYRYDSINTTEGGGQYDIQGRFDDGGRERLLHINIYSKENPYGPNMFDSLEDIEGQYVVKTGIKK
jgi:hypothetical protein